jgi:hypothetical protein
MKHLALTFAATILFASSAFASHPGGGHPGGGGGGGHPGRSVQHSAPAMGGTGGSQAVAITVLQVAAQKTVAEFTIAKSGTTAIFDF